MFLPNALNRAKDAVAKLEGKLRVACGIGAHPQQLQQVRADYKAAKQTYAEIWAAEFDALEAEAQAIHFVLDVTQPDSIFYPYWAMKLERVRGDLASLRTFPRPTDSAIEAIRGEGQTADQFDREADAESLLLGRRLVRQARGYRNYALCALHKDQKDIASAQFRLAREQLYLARQLYNRVHYRNVFSGNWK